MSKQPKWLEEAIKQSRLEQRAFERTGRVATALENGGCGFGLGGCAREGGCNRQPLESGSFHALYPIGDPSWAEEHELDRVQGVTSQASRDLVDIGYGHECHSVCADLTAKELRRVAAWHQRLLHPWIEPDLDETGAA